MNADKALRISSRKWIPMILVVAALTGAALCLRTSGAASSPARYVTISDLLTDNMENPLGLDEVPVFGWKMSSNIIGIKQAAYQIKIYKESLAGTMVWDTGKVASAQSANVELDYDKAANLKKETDYLWTVTVWDNHGAAHTPRQTAFFSTGLAYDLCTQNDADFDNVKDATFGTKATYIGAAKIPLDADSLTVYRISYDFQIERGGTQAGFVYGANEFRLNNAMYNDFLIEGENYINVVVDISRLVKGTGPAQFNVYRKGYGPDDYKQANNTSHLRAFDLPALDAKNMFDKHSVSLTCSGGNLTACTLDGKEFMTASPADTAGRDARAGAPGGPPGVDPAAARAGAPAGGRGGAPGAFSGGAPGFGGGRGRGGPSLTTNPTGRTGDMCKYPRLNDIGFFADGNARFSNVSVRHLNPPSSEVFGAKTGATYGIFKGLRGITLDGDSIIVSNSLVYADPSYGSEPMVRTRFTTASSSDIVDAKLYVTSRGVNQFYINGKRVDSHVVYHTDRGGIRHSRDYLNPGMIQFYGTMRYATYDVAPFLKKNGVNAMGAVLAPGWWGDEYVYNPSFFNWYGEEWGLLAKLVISYKDGVRQEIVTNEEDWKSFLDGPITYSSIYHGEYYDATKEAAVSTRAFGVNGWSTAEYDDSAWTRADYAASSHVNFDNPDYEGRVDYPAHVVEVLSGRLIGTPSRQFANNPKRTVYIYDMGENMVGVPEITFGQTLPAGAVVTLRYGEAMIKKDYLYPLNAAAMDGLLYTENYRGARSLDRYIAKGARGGETYSPSFTFHGWQYLEVSLMGDKHTDAQIAAIMKQTTVKGLQLSSVSRITTTFQSSNKALDRFYLNVARSHYDNHVSVPTDCPQRNERLPFLGDQQIYSETAVYFSDMTQFYGAFAQQARDYQFNAPSRNYASALTARGSYYSKTGVPYDKEASQSNIAWPLGGLTIAWDVLANNGDLSLAREHWNSMKMFVQQYINAGRRDGKHKYLFRGGGLSNHLELSRSSDSGYDQNVTLGRALMYMATMADALGYKEDAAFYTNYFQELKAEFNEVMINARDVPVNYDGRETTAQSSYAMPLYYGMVDLKKHPNFVNNFVERCRNEGPTITTNINGADMRLSEYSITTGFTGTPCVLGALAYNGEFLTAYKMLENEKYASWLYPVTLGARSLWERWNTLTEYGPNSQTMNSFNHYGFGVSAAFMITTCAGIQRGANGAYNNVGFRNFILQPSPGGSLQTVRGTYDSVYGTIVSAWTARPDVVHETSGISDMTSYSAVVPPNTAAVLYLPLGQTINETALKGFKATTGVTYVGTTAHNNIKVAEFRLAAGGYDFKVIEGMLVATLQKGYAAY